MLHCGIGHRKRYPASVRKFCFALHHYSPRGYEYVRKTFNFHLPCSKTIQRWYCASDLRGDPGIQQDTLNRLQTIADAYEQQNKSRLSCSLMVDEMSIRPRFFGHSNDWIMLVWPVQPKIRAQNQLQSKLLFLC